LIAAAALLLAAGVAAAQPTKPVVAAVQPPKSVVAAVQPPKSVVAAVQDREYRAALDLLYDGQPAAAQARLQELARSYPDDPVPVYLEALVLAWIVEQQPQSTALDRTLEQAADRAWTAADARLRADPDDVRALFARGAASGVRSRHHLFRARRAEAARTAVQMREDLLAARARDPQDADVQFGLGLYDYYVDVLPRFARLLRFFSRLPGGDRARGLAAIEEAAQASMLHGVEARVQLYEIHAFYEDDPDAAAADMEMLAARYPGWPLWGLKLAEHLRDRLGAYEESAAVARRMLGAGDTSRPEAGAPALALARLSLGESLLLDLRPEDARHVLLPLVVGDGGWPALAAQARLLIGRSLELEGEGDGAAAHYRAAAADREARKRAQAALAHPLPAGEVEGRRRLALARRAREDGHVEEAAERAREAIAAWPGSREAALGVAEQALREGRAESTRVPAIEEARGDEPPWLAAWSRLLRAQQADARGERAAAVDLYNKVYAHNGRRADLRAAAADGRRAPFRSETPRAAPSAPARPKTTSISTATGAGFIDVRRFSTAACTG
jgi:hypothetical protein